MLDQNKTRFRRAEEALRFYFRLREVLHSGRARRLMADELPEVWCAVATNAIDDYQCIGWCMRGLDEVALWLLSELYGPTCFGVHRRTFSHARKAGKLEFPHREFRLREVGMIHEHALGVVKRGLRTRHDPETPNENRARVQADAGGGQAGAFSQRPRG